MVRFLIDAGVLGALVLALLLVIVLDRVLPTPSQPAPPARTVVDDQTVTTPVPVQSRPLRLAVTQSHRDSKGVVWDDMAKLLGTLGEGYKFTLLTDDNQLYGSKLLDEFDVLFLTCAPPSKEPALTDNLRNFVGRGGTIYASDWRYQDIAKAFPEVASARLRGEGRAGDVEARVVDAGLRDLLGATVPLRFDLSRWKTAAFAGDHVKVLLEGTYDHERGKSQAPLLVKFQFGKGTVIFTSFHNEKQNSAIEQKLLKYLVFSAVTAQIENQVNETLIKGGFAPQKHNLLSASKNTPTASYTYRCTKAGKIRFVLGFEQRGARLRLTVLSPTGQKVEHEGTASFSIEQDSTGPGDWTYTVTALGELPFQDFPFTVTVAESGKQ